MALKKTNKKTNKKKVSLKDLDKEELIELYKKTKKELQEIRFKIVTAAYSDVKKIGSLKKNIARIKTILRLRELEVLK